MFSKEEIDAYKKISAPNELKEKVEKSALNKRSLQMTSLLKIAPAFAACIVLVVSMNLFLKSKSVDIFVNGHKLEESILFYDISPTADMRTSPIYSVPVEVTIEREANLSVSHGNMTVDGGVPTENMNVSGQIMVWWNIERSDKMPKCEMKIEQNGKITLIILEFDNAERTITAKRIIK